LIPYSLIHSSAILDAAAEVCNIADYSTTSHAEEEVDIWVTILSLTRKTASNRRKSIDPPKTNAPNPWKDCNKYAALGNLLSIAVSHKELELRKAYIERIMKLSPTTQRLLMSMLEKRKKLKKTPSKSAKKRPTSLTPQVRKILGASPGGNNGKSKSYYERHTSTSPNGPTDDRYTFSGKRDKSANNTQKGGSGSSQPHKSTEGTSVSSPNILRRSSPESPDMHRRNFHDAFGSPVQQLSAKRMPPPSSERQRNGQNATRNVFSPGLGDTAEYESQVQSIRDENEELARELKRSRQKEEEFQTKMDDLDEYFRKEMLKVEREARERDDKTRQECQSQVSEIQVQLVQVTEECTVARNERDELAKVKDEMEVMSHNNVLLEETTERLRTYKEKVEQLSDIKDALQREEEAHSRSVEENLRMKNELTNLQPLKRQLEEYKTRAVDAEVRLTDCQDELAKLKEQKLASSDVNTQMEQYVMAQEAEIKELLRRVQQNDAANEDGSGVGDGMSELNPELKTEILSLRNENKQLRTFVEKRQDDEVFKLEQNAEDKNMLAERYKDQFLSTKDKLESTEISLTDSKNRESKLQEEVSTTTKLAERYKSQFTSTKSQLESTQLSLQDSKSRESSLREELADSLTKIKRTQIEVEEISTQLSKCTEDLKAGIDRESKLEKELASWTGEAKSLQERSNELSRELTMKTKGLEDSMKQESVLSEDKSKLKEEICLLRQRCTALTDDLQHCTIELEQSHCRESKLEISVKEWMERVQESDKHTQRISANLQQHTEELKQSKQMIARLETDLKESSVLNIKGEESIEKLENELLETKLSLEKTCKSLDQNMQRYLDLQNNLADMTARAEDAENVSTQRIELVQSTREKLKIAEQEIDVLVKEKEDLTFSVDKWTSQTEEARNVNADLERTLEKTHDLMKNTEDKLEEAQASIEVLGKEKAVLTTSVAKWTKETDETKCLAKSVRRELDETICSLNNAEEMLSQSQVLNNHRTSQIETLSSENQKLRNKISHDENLIDSLRNELIETNESIRSSDESIKQLEGRHKLSSERLKDTEKSVANLQNDLLETQEILDSSQQNAQKLEERGILLNKQLEEAERSIQTLQNELLEAKENLKSTQETAIAMEERERLSSEQLEHAEQMLSELEDSFEKEVEAGSSALKKSEIDKSKLKDDFDSREEKLLQSLESEKEKGSKLKQELGEVKNKMNIMQDSLSSLQHREKMLQHEATKLEDKKRECENEISNLKASMDEALKQSSKSLESVREMMTAKLQKELEELQQNMNELLENERKANREQNNLHKDQITKLNQRYNQETLRLNEDNNVEFEKYAEVKEMELKQMKEEYEENIISMEISAKEERQKLMETGKGMMNKIKEKKEKEIKDLCDDVTFLEKRIIKEEDEKKRLAQQFQTKIIEYKKKLQVASGRINTLSADNNDFEDRVKYLGREKLKLREENDRYRRQLGGRSGSDSALNSQLETLQNEFKNAIDENRELKRKMQGQEFRSLSSVGEESSSRHYTRNRPNQSTLLQLRSEYEETIESLNDEKRELIMKNSAAITDVQKAEKRAWLIEQDYSVLKQDLTSLKLSNERLENMLASRQENASPGHASFTQNLSAFEDSAIPKPPIPEMASQFDDASSNGILGTNQGFTNRNDAHMNYGSTSPDQDSKRFVQSTALHSPYRSRSTR
jgi:chromosome segregation ATPase